MPKYYFRVPRGKYSDFQGEATELPDGDAARKEALKIWGDLARGIASQLETEAEWRLDVADGSGKILMEIRTVVDVAR
jgi:Domain of unknown function (DUF6894)